MQLITFFLLLLFAFENFLLLLHRTSAEPCSAALPAAILARHNYYRTLHSSPPLTLNSTLNSQAEHWAEQILATDVFRHRPNRRLSENLFRQISETEVSAKTVVDAWYSESEFYGKFYGREPDLATFSSWRYFTAMIWVSSRELGVGCATKLLENDASNSQSRITYVVTNYSPRGNVVREFAENVRRPRVKTTTTSTTTTAYSTTYKSTSKTSYSTSTSTSKPPYRKPSPKPVSIPTKYTPSTAKPPPPPSFYSTAAAAADTKYRPKATTTTTTTKAYKTTRKTAIYSTTTAATKTYKTTTKAAYKTTKTAYKTTTAKTAYKKSTTTKSPVKYTKYTTKTTAVPITTTTSFPLSSEEYPHHPEALPPSSPYDPLVPPNLPHYPQNPYHHPNPQPSYPLLSNYYRPPLPPLPPPPPQYPSIFSHEDLMDLHEAVYLQRPRPILRPPVHLNIDDLRDLQNNQVKGSGKNSKNKNKNQDKPLFDYDPQNDVYNLVGNANANANSNSTFSAEEYSTSAKPVFYLPANYQPALQKPPSRPTFFPFKPLPLSSFLHLLPNNYHQNQSPPAQNTYQQQPFFRPSFYRPVYRPVTAQRVIYKHQMEQEQQQNKKKKKVKSVDQAVESVNKEQGQQIKKATTSAERPAAAELLN